MSDSLISVTYTYFTELVEHRPNGGGEMEPTGKMVPSQVERTIIVPKNLADEMIEIDMNTQKKTYPNFTLIGKPEHKPVSMVYPAPHYWSN